MKSKILFVALISALVFFSLDRGALVSGYVVNLNNRIVAAYDDAVKFVKDGVNEHFRQREEIKQLRAQNAELEKSAALLSSFAKELNEILVPTAMPNHLQEAAPRMMILLDEEGGAAGARRAGLQGGRDLAGSAVRQGQDDDVVTGQTLDVDGLDRGRSLRC